MLHLKFKNHFNQSSNPFRLSMVFLFVLTIILEACKDEETIKSDAISVDQVIASMGAGTVAHMQYTATGEFIEPHQGGQEMDHLNEVSATFEYTALTALNGRQLDYSWNQSFIYPFAYDGTSRVIINDKNGSIEGAHGLGSRFFGFDAPVPLFPARLEAILKTALMSNPIALLKALEQQGPGTKTNAEFTFTLSQGEQLPEIEIIIDENTLLPVSARTQEADFLLGDVLFEIHYSNWQTVNGHVMYPTQLTYYLGEEIIRTEKRSNVVINPEVPADAFSPAATGSYDEQQGRYGILSSQWYHRMFSFGFSQDFPMAETNITPISDQVFVITGGAELAYVSLAVTTEEGIILIEPSLNPRRSKAVFEVIDKYFGGKPITAVAATHHHMDHFGGVTYFAQLGADVYIGESAVGFVQSVLEAKHELLGISPQNVKVTGISDKVSIEGAFEAIPLPTPHTEDMLVFYFPDLKALYVGDIFNAGLYYGYDYYTPGTQATLKERAQLLRAFIAQQGLEVETLLTVHGGQTTIGELHLLADK